MRKYVIINSDEVSSVNFDHGSLTFVKYDGAKPTFLYGKDTYTHSEILTIIATDEWTDPNPFGE